MAAAMIGVGEVAWRGKTRPAAAALREAGLAPLTLGPKEGLALLNGTQFSCSYALAGLFEAEALFRAALVTGALSRSEEHTSELQSLMRISYAVFCLKKKTKISDRQTDSSKIT